MKHEWEGLPPWVPGDFMGLTMVTFNNRCKACGKTTDVVWPYLREEECAPPAARSGEGKL